MAINKLQSKLNDPNIDPRQRARIQTRIGFEQRHQGNMQSGSKTPGFSPQQRPTPMTRQPMAPQQPQQPIAPQQPMQRPQNPYGSMSYNNGQVSMQAPAAWAQVINQQPYGMANRFAGSMFQGDQGGNLNGQNPNFQLTPPPAGEYNDYAMRYSPQESMAMRQQMQQQMQNTIQQKSAYQQQAPMGNIQPMPYMPQGGYLRGNSGGLL